LSRTKVGFEPKSDRDQNLIATKSERLQAHLSSLPESLVIATISAISAQEPYTHLQKKTMTKIRRNRIPEGEWEHHKSAIKMIYLDERSALEGEYGVINTMRSRYDFSARQANPTMNPICD
jgi:hypothetical protein